MLLVGGICCGLPLLIGGLVYYEFGLNLPRKRAAVQQLAERMDLVSVGDSPRRPLYRGQHHGYPFEIGLGAKRNADTKSYRLALQLVVMWEMAEPLRGYVGCNRRPRPGQGFDQAFGKARMGMDDLPAAVQSKLLTFARAHESVHLEGVPLNGDSAEGPPQMRLEHTLSHGFQASPSDIRELLDELIEIVQMVEASPRSS